MRNTWYLILASVVLLAFAVESRTLTEDRVPEPLRPWIDWVLLDEASYRCPFHYSRFDEKVCSWPSRLTLELDRRSGRFSLTSKAFAESWVQLPGSLNRWPLNVAIDQNSAPVTERAGKPFIKLQPGLSTVSGRFFWDRMPDNLEIPENAGLITLTVNGEVIDHPLFKQGQLWLKGGEAEPATEDKLELQVFRRVEDGVPLQLLTRMELEVSGSERELSLRPPMPGNFMPLKVTTALPYRMEAGGDLILKLRPGRYRVDLWSRHIGPVEQLNLNIFDPNWPKHEIWAFQAYPHLRLVEIENVQAVDAQLTNLPDDWKNLPAYRVEHGNTMAFKVIRRGDPEPEPDRLNIERTLWLDFDGKGYAVNDKIHGRMTRAWRLNALPGTQLGKVSLDGRDQLITRLPDSELNGVEVRKGEINLNADGRIGTPIDRISAVGWQETFHSVRATLNLPPGWRLLAAKGVDNVPDSWISRWTLLDLFLVLVGSLAIGHLWNVYWAAFALVALALIWHEPDSPQWIWLNLLAAAALLRVLPRGRFFGLVKFYWNASWIVLLVILIPFLIDQVRMGLYPQLEKPWQAIGPSFPAEFSRAQKTLPSAPLVLEQKAAPEPPPETFERERAAALDTAPPEKPRRFDEIAPDANIQTGPGLPQWQWTAIQLSWNGPVDSTQEIDFWYLGPLATMLLNFLRALLAALLALLLHGRLPRKFGVHTASAWLLILPMVAVPAHRAEAAFPDSDLLKELKSRLLEPPDCLPGCAAISELDVTIGPKSMVIELVVDLHEEVSFPLPGEAQQWIPQRVSVDGKDAEALYRTRDGILWTHLGAGRHRLQLTGLTPPLQKFSVPLPLNPYRLSVKAEGWMVEGIHEGRSPDAQIQFTRQRDSREETQPFETSSDLLPPFVRIERTLRLGLDWRVETRVVRVSPPGAAVVLEVPLLAGESVTTAGIRVQQGRVLVNLSADQTRLQWQSVLDKASTIQLTAAETDEWTEIWRADISPIWHMQSEGIAVIHHQDQQGHWMPEWQPWPGEAVILSIDRPEAVPGQTLTIDSSRLHVSPGKRVREVILDFTLRSSRGTQHAVTLPEQAVLQSVSIDQRTQPIRQRGRQVTLPVRPGSQRVSLKWRDGIPMSTWFETPETNLGIESVNTALSVVLSEDRWILLTLGPRFGPAVLFWGVLLVVAVFAYALGKIRLTPLRHWQWFLLLVGLTQIPIGAALIPVAWLIVVGYRGAHPNEYTRYFNLTQFGIGLLTLISLSILFLAINQGLLGSPEMQVEGNRSSAFQLNWFQDRSPAVLPRASVISVPLAAYRILMLAWSLWLALSFVNWLKWGWSCFSAGGLWRKKESGKVPAIPAERVDRAPND